MRPWWQWNGNEWIDWPAGALPHNRTPFKTDFLNQFVAWKHFISQATVQQAWTTMIAPGDRIQSANFWNFTIGLSSFSPFEAGFFTPTSGNYNPALQWDNELTVGQVISLSPAVSKPPELQAGDSLQSENFLQWLLDVRSYLDACRWIPLWTENTGTLKHGSWAKQRNDEYTEYNSYGVDLIWSAWSNGHSSWNCINQFASDNTTLTCGLSTQSIEQCALVLQSVTTQKTNCPFPNPIIGSIEVVSIHEINISGESWSPFGGYYGKATAPEYLYPDYGTEESRSKMLLYGNVGNELPVWCRPTTGWPWED